MCTVNCSSLKRFVMVYKHGDHPPRLGLSFSTPLMLGSTWGGQREASVLSRSSSPNKKGFKSVTGRFRNGPYIY